MKGGRDRKNQRGGDTDVSKTLSWVLRHGAVEQGLTLESSGYVPLEQVMQFLRRKGCKNIDQQRIYSIVNNNDKKRFQIQQRKHHKFIRATQGHSMKQVNTQQLLTKITDPTQYPTVIHGTFSKFWPSIKASGLKRMTRNHIHFAPGLPKEEGVISGMRQSCDIIIEIDLKAAIEDGIQFFISTNNVILTEGDEGVLSPKYFLRVSRKDGTLIEGKQENPLKKQEQKAQQRVPVINIEEKHQKKQKKEEQQQ